MNHYGAQMMEFWERERLPEYQEIRNPEEHFTQVGEEIALAVESRARALAGTAPSQEGYLARLKRLNTARFQAEGEVVREYLLQETTTVQPPQEP
ncbi:hypothetical protein [Streptomyces botrytidirepellens]|uniref:Uncharacterized protein n=1 Tax=Streptomyces botrytidirepellens TaxID=2486417 RepID=A0A3M8W7T8_9ACTN|nr:hypothetical protein [Streptomyces botrytidirepellens]RNG26126.1 hypothetical protein EEJ42_16075 [Streptomyces botrytidirepellens]